MVTATGPLRSATQCPALAAAVVAAAGPRPHLQLVLPPHLVYSFLVSEADEPVTPTKFHLAIL